MSHSSALDELRGGREGCDGRGLGPLGLVGGSKVLAVAVLNKQKACRQLIRP
jgi:hypothetical protein